VTEQLAQTRPVVKKWVEILMAWATSACLFQAKLSVSFNDISIIQQHQSKTLTSNTLNPLRLSMGSGTPLTMRKVPSE
jgi:hypothetical protein